MAETEKFFNYLREERTKAVLNKDLERLNELAIALQILVDYENHK